MPAMIPRMRSRTDLLEATHHHKTMAVLSKVVTEVLLPSKVAMEVPHPKVVMAALLSREVMVNPNMLHNTVASLLSKATEDHLKVSILNKDDLLSKVAHQALVDIPDKHHTAKLYPCVSNDTSVGHTSSYFIRSLS